MALILVPEDGTGLANANSYASAADLAAYIEAHLYPGAAATADAARKAAALVHATRMINAHLDFNGQPYGTVQALDWPRAGRDLPWPVPQRLKDATCELAIDLLKGDRFAEADSAGISDLGLGQGALTLKFDPEDVKAPLPEPVRALLAPLGQLRGGTRMVPVLRGY